MKKKLKAQRLRRNKSLRDFLEKRKGNNPVYRAAYFTYPKSGGHTELFWEAELEIWPFRDYLRYSKCASCYNDITNDNGSNGFYIRPTCFNCQSKKDNMIHSSEVDVKAGQYFHQSRTWLLGHKDYIPALFKRATEAKETLYSRTVWCYNTRETENGLEFYDKLIGIVKGYSNVYHVSNAEEVLDNSKEHPRRTIFDTFTTEQYVIHTNFDQFSKFDQFVAYIVSRVPITDSVELTDFINVITSLPQDQPRTVTKGNLNVLKENNGELSLSEIGTFHKEIKLENYSEDITNEFKFLIDEIKSDDPLGRIVILRGDPGTGKTSFIRGLINECESSCLFVMVPVNMVGVFSSSALLELLISMRDDYPHTKVVFIIEDADKILAPRQMDNATIISVMLNFTDGLYNSLFDIRVIATTNEEITEFDSAIVRPGRLSKIIEFTLHDYEKANEIFQRETNQTEVSMPRSLSKKEWHLGEIYWEIKAFKGDRQVPELEASTSKEKTIGFSSVPRSTGGGDIRLSRHSPTITPGEDF
jgi:ATP-dependent 26S proteasome regulatory subunit